MVDGRTGRGHRAAWSRVAEEMETLTVAVAEASYRGHIPEKSFAVIDLLALSTSADLVVHRERQVLTEKHCQSEG